MVELCVKRVDNRAESGAPSGVVIHAPHGHLHQCGISLRVGGHRQHAPLEPHSPHHLHRVHVLPGRLPRDHFPQHHTEAVHVCGLSVPLAAQHLGRHPLRCAARRRSTGHEGVGSDLRQPKVAELDLPRVVNQNVGALEVEVQDGRFPAVQVRHATGNAQGHRLLQLGLQRGFPLAQDAKQATTLHVLGDDGQCGLDGVAHKQEQVGVTQVSKHPHFLPKLLLIGLRK
mmetsp:Transcript_18946/g.33792  ORF Transcript_18946/g.33792 Transcript_18946/m.33792 type:complete len:228 (-) Transcript_18946:1164-1847(-)